MLSVMNDLKPITLFAKLDVAYSAPEVAFDSRGPGYDIVPAMAIPQSAIGQFEDEWLGVGGSLVGLRTVPYTVYGRIDMVQ